MNYIKEYIYGPDPKEAFRKSKAITRKNIRQLDREINSLSPLQKKTESLIKKAIKSNDKKSAKVYAKELISMNKQKTRLTTSRATLNSISYQLDEQQQRLKLNKNISQSTSIMKEINSLVKLPQLSHTVQELQKELMKAGVLNEMMDDMTDTMEDDELMQSETEEDEINDILNSFVSDKIDKLDDGKISDLISEDQQRQAQQQQQQEQQQKEAQEEVEGEQDGVMDEMRERLRALQS
ncbi:hypothetical protein PACTADRAFT_52012 [Pachysolen tannophilus NRRL Y-2460]|uniref:Vacuolar protein-sorting-associated protein 24 n=1 Tax=Pachysolen tannophilus NRRL Y-2460 TaxID=669874 RepID=A0A1E4TNT6_PACTA|nr:hypothetical protein PACTADRAFT_52012 [Pachysolen tannophilus NRRL Y-2460]